MTEIWIVGLAALLGVMIGALIVIIAFNLRIRYEERRDIRRRMLEHKTKEIETVLLLNQKFKKSYRNERLPCLVMWALIP